MRIVDVFYMTLPVNNADQAVSLTEYLNQHGFSAVREGVDAVTCPIDDETKVPVINSLRKGWEMFWEHSDSGLFGLPVYYKP
jgi:hypothetical protein